MEETNTPVEVPSGCEKDEQRMIEQILGLLEHPEQPVSASSSSSSAPPPPPPPAFPHLPDNIGSCILDDDGYFYVHGSAGQVTSPNQNMVCVYVSVLEHRLCPMM
jgi:hypothetical protein